MSKTPRELLAEIIPDEEDIDRLVALFDEAWDAGYAQGYEDGDAIGGRKAYEAGFEDGYREGRDERDMECDCGW